MINCTWSLTDYEAFYEMTTARMLVMRDSGMLPATPAFRHWIKLVEASKRDG